MVLKGVVHSALQKKAPVLPSHTDAFCLLVCIFVVRRKKKRKSAAVCLSRECRNNPAADSFHWKHYLLKKKKSIKLVLVFQTNQEIVNVSFPRFEHYGPNSIQTATVLMSLRPAAVPPADVIFQSGPILVTVFLKKS